MSKLVWTGLQATTVAETAKYHSYQNAHGQKHSQEETIHWAEPHDEQIRGIWGRELKGGCGKLFPKSSTKRWQIEQQKVVVLRLDGYSHNDVQ